MIWCVLLFVRVFLAGPAGLLVVPLLATARPRALDIFRMIAYTALVHHFRRTRPRRRDPLDPRWLCCRFLLL